MSYWPLGNIQGTSVPDIVGSNDGTPTSLSESDVVSGYNQYRNALQFDGAADNVETGVNLGTGVLTFSVWFRPKSLGEASDGTVIADDINQLLMRSGPKIGWTHNGGANIASIDINGLNVWSHIVVLRDSNGTESMFLDGKVKDSGAPGAVGAPSNTVQIGDRPAEGKAFDGDIQDVMYWNRELAELEIELLYKHQKQGKKI